VADFLRARKHGPSAGPDPWSANSLEWSTASPPPPYNFRTIPVVRSRDPLWDESPETEPTQPDWMNQLAFPDQPLREVVETTPVEAAPDDIVALPGPSLWPLWTALSVVVALIGVLMSQYVLAIVGASLTGVTMIGWAATDPGDVPERYFTQKRRATIGVWGLSVGLVSLSALFGSLLVAHYYLMVAPEVRRPIAEVNTNLVWVALGLALVSAVTCVLARRLGTPQATALILVVALITALGSALSGILIAADQMPVASFSAQASSVVALVGFGAVVGALLGGGIIAAAARVLRGSANTPGVLQSLQMFSVFLLVVWVVIAAVILTTPWVPS
jgi:heme/copper-type cytochrome/quinol oxidase subunit 3